MLGANTSNHHFHAARGQIVRRSDDLQLPRTHRPGQDRLEPLEPRNAQLDVRANCVGELVARLAADQLPPPV